LLKEKIFLEKKKFNILFNKDLIFYHIKKIQEGFFLQNFLKQNIFQNKKFSEKELSIFEKELLLLQEKIELEEKANS
jgi:hypothetical protein